jgi:AcrR family transcriptional regulator
MANSQGTTMTGAPKRRARNPDATKKAILEASVACLAASGPEGVTLSDVAQQAGVNRSTAYEYFETRENLIKETREWASDKLFRAVFGDPVTLGKREVEKVDMLELIERIATFAMSNADLCRVWLMQVLSLPDPNMDPFWKEYEGGSARFAKTNHAQKGMDAEVFTVIQLAGALLLRDQVQKYVRECIRFAFYGSVRPDYYPGLVERLQLPEPAKPSREAERIGKSNRDTTKVAKAVAGGATLTLTFENGGAGSASAPGENGARRQTVSLYDEDALKIWRLCGATLFGADHS